MALHIQLFLSRSRQSRRHLSPFTICDWARFLLAEAPPQREPWINVICRQASKRFVIRRPWQKCDAYPSRYGLRRDTAKQDATFKGTNQDIEKIPKRLVFYHRTPVGFISMLSAAHWMQAMASFLRVIDTMLVCTWSYRRTSVHELLFHYVVHRCIFVRMSIDIQLKLIWLKWAESHWSS